MTADRLHRRLTRLADATASAAKLRPASWWVGDVAGQRRVLDDMAAGRLNWSSANKMARLGLKALAEGDLEMAEICAWSATDHYIAALEARIRPDDMNELGRINKRRGRPKKVKRN
jgi:hypothetical protein